MVMNSREETEQLKALLPMVVRRAVGMGRCLEEGDLWEWAVDGLEYKQDFDLNTEFSREPVELLKDRNYIVDGERLCCDAGSAVGETEDLSIVREKLLVLDKMDSVPMRRTSVITPSFLTSVLCRTRHGFNFRVSLGCFHLNAV